MKLARGRGESQRRAEGAEIGGGKERGEKGVGWISGLHDRGWCVALLKRWKGVFINNRIYFFIDSDLFLFDFFRSNFHVCLRLGCREGWRSWEGVEGTPGLALHSTSPAARAAREPAVGNQRLNDKC